MRIYRTGLCTITAATFAHRNPVIHLGAKWIATQDFAVQRERIANQADFWDRRAVERAFARVKPVVVSLDDDVIDNAMSLVNSEKGPALGRTDWIVDVGRGRRDFARMFDNAAARSSSDRAPLQALVWERLVKTFHLWTVYFNIEASSFVAPGTHWLFGKVCDKLPDPTLILTTLGTGVGCTDTTLPQVTTPVMGVPSPTALSPLPVGLRQGARNVARRRPRRAIDFEEEE
jgi:hypothetical protein